MGEELQEILAPSPPHQERRTNSGAPAMEYQQWSTSNVAPAPAPTILTLARITICPKLKITISCQHQQCHRYQYQNHNYCQCHHYHQNTERCYHWISIQCKIHTITASSDKGKQQINTLGWDCDIKMMTPGCCHDCKGEIRARSWIVSIVPCFLCLLSSSPMFLCFNWENI